MAYYDRHRSHRSHRSNRTYEHRHKESHSSPFSFRNRIRESSYVAQYQYAEPTYTSSITNLPSDLKLSIFDHLDPVSSACFGLSSRHLYPSYRYKHNRVSLYEQADDQLPLCFALKDWAPDNLVLDPRSGRYVRWDKYERRHGDREEGERKRDFWSGRLRRKGRVVNLRRGEERLRRVRKVVDLRGDYYGVWR